MKLQIRPLCGLFLLLSGVIHLSGVDQAAHGQGEPTPIYSASNLDNLYWSPDSSTLVFQRRGVFGDGVVLEDGEYFAYDVQSGNLTSSSRWPLQPTLSSEEYQIFAPYPPVDGALPPPPDSERFRFLSPNRRFMIYEAGTEPTRRRFATGDRDNLLTRTFDVLVGQNHNTSTFFTLWSADSRSVVIGNNPLLGDFPRYFYVTDYTDDVQVGTIEEIMLDALVNGREYGGGYVEDISMDGQTLLMSPLDVSSIAPGVRGRVVLASYRPSDASVTIHENTSVRQQLITASAFDPDDERYIVVLQRDGIQRYNTIANTWQMLNPDVRSRDSGRAIFSPDGRYLAVQSFRLSSRQVDIYVIDLSEVPPPPEQAVQLRFAEVPSEVLANNPLPPVRVLAADMLGSAAPFVTVTLSLGDNSTGAVLSGTLTAITDETGAAAFTELSIDQAGAGYTLVAEVEEAAAVSAPFTVALPTPTPTPPG
jgi:hypothetical protein